MIISSLKTLAVARPLAVIILGTTECRIALRVWVKAEPLEIDEVFAVDMDFDGIAWCDIEHFMDVVFGRDEDGDGAGFMDQDIGALKLGVPRFRAIIETAEPAFLDLIADDADHAPGPVIVRFCHVPRTPDHGGDVEARGTMQHVPAMAITATPFKP